MAWMGRGEPQSVRDPAGEAYDAMLRQERLKRERAEIAAPSAQPPLSANLFSPSARLAALRQAPARPSSTVKIDGQTYREFDNGRANVLVPTDDPLVSPVELAERRRAIERAFFMAGNPLAGAAYGIATLANAAPHVRDRALMAGGLADAAMHGAAPFGARTRGRPAPAPQGHIAPPTSRRPDIRYGERNAKGQATGVTATLTTPMLGSGTRADRRLTPPGWQGNGTIFKKARGHLLGNQLGGSGGEHRNLVTLTQNRANSPEMRDFENTVARRVRGGEVVEYSATPIYRSGILPPSAVLVTSLGSRSGPSARLIHNPAGRRR